MNRSISLVFSLAIAMGALAGCSSGPTCQPIPAVPTCDPACDITMEYCSATNTCSPFPMACDPTCGAGEFCDDGTCVETPEPVVCSPACGAGEYCTN
jgi:hypothetical protein